MNTIQELNVAVRYILADCPDYQNGMILSREDFDNLVEHVTRTATFLVSDMTMDWKEVVATVLETHIGIQYQIAPAVTIARHPTAKGRDLFRYMECPELALCEYDPCHPDHLVSRQFDYGLSDDEDPDHVRYKDPILEARRKQVRALKKIPFHTQGTQEWLDQRTGCLTATAMTVILDQDNYETPFGMLLDKCGRGKKFRGNEDTQHGSMLEEVGVLWYQHRYNVQVMEHGLIGHPEHSFLGASPDGICTRYTNDGLGCSKLVGRLLEIKFPSRRQLKSSGRLNGDIVPHHYFTQMQAQCFATGLTECDFLQCKASQYPDWDAYLADTHPVIPTLSKDTGLEKGVLIQLFLRKDPDSVLAVDPHDPERDDKIDLARRLSAQYIYPPKLHMSAVECQLWLAEQLINFPTHKYFQDYMIDKVVYWRLDKVSCHLVHADLEWQEEVVPIAEQFWSYVCFYRKHPELLDELEKLAAENSPNTAAVFSRAEEHYQEHSRRGKKDRARRPLYQASNPWRDELNRKKAYYRRG